MSPGAQNMKMGPDALDTAENENGSAKHENGTSRPRYRRKRVQERKTLKRDPTPSVSPKRVRARKTWKRDRTPSLPPKTSPGAQNIKKEPDALGTVENETGHAKYEKVTRHPRYYRTWVRKRKTWKRDPTPSVPPKTSPGYQNMKTGPDALRIVENKSGRAKHENVTRRHRYRRNRVRERKTCKRDPTPSVHPKTSPSAQNIKTRPDALGTAENESERNTWKRNPTPSVPPKMSSGAQNNTARIYSKLLCDPIMQKYLS
jgi:hypothetical protein